tara:strand:+ start:3156 stop:3617 length:462 start_codon:yes stop_codon:yes gene_type:complete
MGTELTATSLVVTITEALAVDHANGATNDIDFAQTYTHTYASIANVSKKIIKLANTNLTEIATFSTDTADGAFVRADVRYIRVTNLDGSDALQVGLDDEASDAGYTSVAADSSIIYTGTTVEGDNGGSTLDNATALKVKGAANQQLELFIASV